MSDRELRQVLLDVIDDIDAGQVVPRRGRSLRTFLAGSVLAAGLAMTGCETSQPLYGVPMYGVPMYGVPITDARPDVGATDANGIPLMDAGVDATPTADARVDAGPTEDYGAPDVDAGTEWDDGGVFLYGVPPMPEDER